MINNSSPTRPKIVHALGGLQVGGVETMCLEVIRHFSSKSDNYVVVQDAKQQEMRPAFEESGVHITAFDHQPRKYARVVRQNYDYFKAVRPDALICWSFGMHAFVGLGARFAGVPHIIVHVANTPPLEFKQAWKWCVLARIGYLSMPILVGCSEYVRKRLIDVLKLSPSRVFAINNGCDVNGIRRRAQERTKLKRGDKKVIGMVARFNEIKDQRTLVEAMPFVLAAHPQAELWLIGEGELQNSIKQVAARLGLQEKVKFMGNRFDIPELMGQMDVFALSTTEAEGLPLVLTEALAAGVPIVASDVGPCAYTLKQGDWGKLVEPANPRKLGVAINESLSGSYQKPEFDAVFNAYDTGVAAQQYWKLLFA